jgi:hypothetical protein
MDRITCQHCEAENKATFKYCSSCGYELPKVKTETLVNTIEEPQSKKRNKLKIPGLITGAIAFLISYYLFNQFVFVSYDKVMMQTASELNKTCPIMVDSETRLDNTIALPDNVFQYNYTLINLSKEEADIEGLKSYLEPTIINFVRTNPQMQIQRDHKTTITYYYKDKEGNFLFDVKVSPDLYN